MAPQSTGAGATLPPELQEKTEGWFIIELMGHRRLGGFVREVTVAGAALVRVDVPGDEPGTWIASPMYGASAIYCLTPTTERMARAVAKQCRVEPVTRWELQEAERPRLPAPPRRIDDLEIGGASAALDDDQDGEEEDEEQDPGFDAGDSDGVERAPGAAAEGRP